MNPLLYVATIDPCEARINVHLKPNLVEGIAEKVKTGARTGRQRWSERARERHFLLKCASSCRHFFPGRFSHPSSLFGWKENDGMREAIRSKSDFDTLDAVRSIIFHVFDEFADFLFSILFSSTTKKKKLEKLNQQQNDELAAAAAKATEAAAAAAHAHSAFGSSPTNKFLNVSFL